MGISEIDTTITTIELSEGPIGAPYAHRGEIPTTIGRPESRLCRAKIVHMLHVQSVSYCRVS